MKPRKLIWQLFPFYLAITLLAIIVISYHAADFFKSFYLDHVRQDLEARARMVSGQIAGYILSGNTEAVRTVCTEIGKTASTRITVILPSGKVIGDSWENPDLMISHVDRPEIVQALDKKTGVSVRYSRTINEKMMYLAIPIAEQGKTLALLRTSIPLTQIEAMYQKIRNQIIMVGFMIALISAGVSLYVSRRITLPIEEMTQSAGRYASGELSHRIYVDASAEFKALADSMNVMADQLEKRMDTVMRQRNELEAVLASMREGILAINLNDTVISVNHAAASMFDKKPADMVNRAIQEVIRNPDLHRTVREALAGNIQAEEDILFYNPQEQTINIHCTQLMDARNIRTGILVVLNNVTRLRRLETIRRDFATNVSHEIKTPLTAIKGFVETLRSGAMNEPEQAARFLAIIEKHVDRLTAVIDDLMELSRLEQTGKHQALHVQDTSVQDIVKNAVQLCQTGIETRQIQILTECEENLRVRVNPALIEQAVKNLVENAVNYSDIGGTVRISCVRGADDIQITVRDDGCGISKDHLPRIFERFYRVDKSRSRKQGGTGLGLAIVKHIVQVHSGHITVESVLGKGSAFTVHLPGGMREFGCSE